MEFDEIRADSNGFDNDRELDFDSNDNSDDDIEPDRKQALEESFFVRNKKNNQIFNDDEFYDTDNPLNELNDLDPDALGS
jgi:hypothetical protein